VFTINPYHRSKPVKILSNSKYGRMKAKTEKLEWDLRYILVTILSLLRHNDKFQYRYNEPGTGDICYMSDTDTIEFNEFSSDFNGFYINDRKSTIDEVVKLLI
jgi:hypothetical protein